MHTRSVITFRNQQAGLASILTIVCLLALLILAGVVFEVGRAYKLKSTLQNSADAAALAAVTEFYNVDDKVAARAAAHEIINQHLAHSANSALIVDTSTQTTVEFFTALVPLQPAGDSGDVNFIRVRINNVNVSLLTALFPFNAFDLSVSAVAGLSPALTNICDLSPLLVCARLPEEGATDSSDYLGYNFEEIVALKISANDESGVGPGNFHLLDAGSGGDAVRESLAGNNSEFCVSNGTTVTTLPGNTVGPVAQGLNARFADANSGPLNGSYPPDLVRTDPSGRTNGPNGDVTGGYTAYPDTSNPYLYSNYKEDLLDCQSNASSFPSKCASDGTLGRRILSVAMVDCSADDTSGVANLPVLGFGCFFIPQSLTLAGNASETIVYGELVKDCDGQGNFTGDPTPHDNDSSVVEVVLYKDPGNGDL